MKPASEAIQFDAQLTGPRIPADGAKLNIRFEYPMILAPEFAETEIKLEEARFFLNFLRQNAYHHALVLFGLSAFLSAARSVTLYLQAEGRRSEGFDDWYAQHRTSLKSNKFAKFLKDTRDLSAHKMYAGIRLTLLAKPSPDQRHELSVGFEFEDHEFLPGLEPCEAYLNVLGGIIERAKTEGFLRERAHSVRFGIQR